MKLGDIRNSITTLPGVGPAAAKLFAKLNVFSVADLLTLYPKQYDDRTKRIPLSAFRSSKVHCAALVVSHEWFGYGRMKTLKLIISDGEAEAELVAFNRPFLEKQFPVGAIISVTGAFDIKYGKLQSTSFEIIKLSESGDLSDYEKTALPDSRVLPVYPLTEGLNQKNVRKTILAALREYSAGIENELPDYIMEKHKLLSKRDAIRAVHAPESLLQAEEARQTLIYEELFHFQCVIAKRAWEHRGAVPDASLSLSPFENTEECGVKSGSGKSPSAGTDESGAADGISAGSIAPEIGAHDGADGGIYDATRQIFIDSLSPLQRALYDRLPFRLTFDQMNVIMEMDDDLDRGYRERELVANDEKKAPAERAENERPPVFTMARLLQGDVGSGKTLAAFFACLRVISWKGQCAFMAPTELLARQHAENASHMLAPLGIRVAFLTGNVKAGGRAELLKQLKAGNIDIVIGTHALFSEAVQYNDLQLAVIDEQHRFGVLQRQAIIEKGRKIAGTSSYTLHLLMMSATPIPQTLALTAFGDLDVSLLRTQPEGRKAVKTYLVREGNEANAYEAVRKELEAGHQAYFVYPAIESDGRQTDGEDGNGDNMESVETAHARSEADAKTAGAKRTRNAQFPLLYAKEKSAAKAAEEMFAFLSERVYSEFECALIHSRIDEDEQVRILRDFQKGRIQVLAATTVIEVGVDVPNATCIVIEQADRFGLAQLHQLRGRVGRGDAQSYCFLIYGKNITETGIERMKVLRENTDGFFIAERDLKLRGPGEVTGTAQSGDLELGIADIRRDGEILVEARNDAFEYMRSVLR
ncbi:ATP-dependent DNA helicase RecG [Treponema sp. Marseille-Q4523]|uniref:ATP-dependent DNA helicase RecG n=1 Tax=Treponema sp. Marseille-Q4523 TaxID=2810610 RepID=UPI001961BBD5|nr:ATP-dependent DNA helicase RecG [Treponema sp. Marseille-Q4523]MBM7022077.1 ATP-dependent DNA helicase RecG [Treponema sp. Marseille-Q4523]